MTTDTHQHQILILDFGSQYTQLIARRIREIGVYCKILDWDSSQKAIQKLNPNGIILSGGPESTTSKNSPRAPEYVFRANIPVLGICYGMQTMSIQLGGKVETSGEKEFGYSQVSIQESCNLFYNIYDTLNSDGKALLDVWMSYKDKVIAIPNDFKLIGSTNSCPFAIIANDKKRFYGIQFHPEVTHTYQGNRILRRFVLDICGCKSHWTAAAFIEDMLQQLKEKIGSQEVILALSGGIDSSVTAVLLNHAIGKQLTCVFVDNGLLRLNEAEKIMSTFSKCKFKLNIIKVDAEERFFRALLGVHDPELKRKIIGSTFIEVLSEEAAKKTQVKWLAQGTIYPDIIESGSSRKGKVHVIKSHHNVGGLPIKMKLKLLEPLKELFKDEVRKVGLELGLPYEMLYSHPFPGAGLGVRIVGEVKKAYCDLLRHADAIFVEELHKANLYYKVSQAFVVFLPVRSVGIMGDDRKYDWVVSLRAIETSDFMTAKWAHLPYNFLGKVSNRIVNEVNGISRVVYDITGKPPATIEWE